MLFVCIATLVDVAEPLASLAAALVEVERLVPVALVVGLDAEVVERAAWPLRSPSSS